MPKLLRARLPDIIVFTILLGSFMFFTHANPGWNVNSRFALTLAWAETGSPVVDRYVTRPELETKDLATYNNHLYSDKSIGTSLLGVPAAWLVRGLEAALDHTFPMDVRLALVTILSVGVAGALSGVLLMHWLNRLCAGWRPSDNAAIDAAPTPAMALTAMAAVLGSLLYLYGTLFMSYLPATAFLLGCILLAQPADNARYPTLTFFAAGLCGGITVLCEYLYGVAVAAVGGWMLLSLLAARRPLRQLIAAALAFGVGGILGVLPFFVYTYMIFGRIGVPYEYHLMPEFREAMSRGFMGATAPRAGVLWLISFHWYRGLFVYSPLLLLGLAGLVRMLWGPRKHRAVAALCLLCSLFYFVFNSAYYMWWGGWSFAPRHLAPAVPFLAAGLAAWLSSRAGRIIILITGAAGVAVHTLVNATEPQPPDGGWQTALLQPSLTDYHYPSALATYTLPRAAEGQWEHNIGMALGLPGGWSLMALVAWWAVGLIALYHVRALQNDPAPEQSH